MFFINFKKEDYTFYNDYKRRVTNITQYASIMSKLVDDISYYTYYNMQDGERLDTISEKLYDTPDYYWTIMYLNPKLINSWKNLPLAPTSFDAVIKDRYPGRAFIIKDTETLAGKFKLGEEISYSNNTAEILGLYPTLGYMHVNITQGEFPFDLNFGVYGLESLDTIEFKSNIPAYLAPSYYKDVDGNYTTHRNPNKIPTTIREVEAERNISYSKIRVLRADVISKVVMEFEKEMRK